MAASLSRPDPSSPASVAEAAFSTARRGFHTDEVRAFLIAVAAEMGRLQERERQLLAELRAARDETSSVELDDETVTKLLGEETLRVLHTARESASEIKIRAEENAARIVRDANDEVNRLRQEIEIDVARQRQDANADAEAEVALAKQQGREMVNEARAYRERVLADLDRRTTLARQQIEDLILGRDRLLQVFERARLVAVDVTSELRAIDEPDELVNLTPTTGPLPIMVPNQRRQERTADDRPEGADDVEVDANDAVRSEQGLVVGEPSEISEMSEMSSTPDAGDDPSAPDDTDLAPPTDDDDEANQADTGQPTDAGDIDEIDGPAAGDEIDDPADAIDGPTSGEVEPNRDTNVVSLFRVRALPSDSEVLDDHPSAEGAEHDDDADDKPDVGGIFERLRQETIGADEAAGDTGAEDHDGSAAVVASEITEPDTTTRNTTTRNTTMGTPEAAESVEIAMPTAFSRRDEALVPLIVSGARRVKRVLADEQNEALDMLRRGEPVTSLDALVPLADEHVSVYVKALADEFAQAACAGAAEAGIKITKTLLNKLVKAGAIDAANDQVRSELVLPLRERLARAVAGGDGDNEDITKRVRAVYREWKTQHIDDQLDDVFRRAFNGGLFAAIEPGEPIVWTIDPSTAACPDCEDNSLAGAVAAGEAFPTGHATVPGHPGCRCLTLPAD